MRLVNAAAMQPAHIRMPESYSPWHEGYLRNTDAILYDYVAPQLAVTERLLDQAGAEGCDIVSTCEDVSVLSDFAMDITDGNVFSAIVKRAEPMIETALSAAARKHRMYVVGCYLKNDCGAIYNTAVIFNREGVITGEYKKTHLPANEAWQCTPGDCLDVFELDFGRIGICICYDMMFPETVRVLALKGAEIIIHPTFGYGWYDSIGEATLRTRANDNGVYIVTAKDFRENGAGKSSVIDYWGHVLADAGFRRNVIVTASIDLDLPKEQPDGYINSAMSGIANVTVRMKQERRPELYHMISEPSDRLLYPDPAEKERILSGIRNGTYRW
jgi:predicted amidohydrolase